MGCNNVALDLSDWSYGTICDNDHYTYRSILYTLNKILVNINLYNFARCIHHCMPQIETTHTANKKLATFVVVGCLQLLCRFSLTEEA